MDFSFRCPKADLHSMAGDGDLIGRMPMGSQQTESPASCSRLPGSEGFWGMPPCVIHKKHNLWAETGKEGFFNPGIVPGKAG